MFLFVFVFIFLLVLVFVPVSISVSVCVFMAVISLVVLEIACDTNLLNCEGIKVLVGC